MGTDSTVVLEEPSVNKVRAAAAIAVVTTAVTRARQYAREHPDQAGQRIDDVQAFLRGRAPAKYVGSIDQGADALRRGLGIGARGTAPRSGLGDLDLDPDPDQQPAPRRFEDPVAPNPSPGTTDDPQPRRLDEDPAPLTPGERPHA